MEQQSLFDLDTIPEAALETATTASKVRWAVYRERNGILYVLYQTHSDEVTWMRSDLKRKPHLYRTERGAWKAAKELDGAYVLRWTD